jgi:hypothetical protein
MIIIILIPDYIFYSTALADIHAAIGFDRFPFDRKTRSFNAGFMRPAIAETTYRFRRID